MSIEKMSGGSAEDIDPTQAVESHYRKLWGDEVAEKVEEYFSSIPEAVDMLTGRIIDPIDPENTEVLKQMLLLFERAGVKINNNDEPDERGKKILMRARIMDTIGKEYGDDSLSSHSMGPRINTDGKRGGRDLWEAQDIDYRGTGK